ncbi:MAG: dihydrodipicolinate synthase family protein [Alteromonadaceae bacterium]|nr:dihydrodipicolinate synthase family protein [Alteromonadaceae bacterium]
MKTSFAGIFPYLPTPVFNNGDVNTKVLGQLCDDLISQGVHGLSPLGSTGEFPYLTWQQKCQVVEATISASSGRVPVIGSVSSTTTSGAIYQARHFEKMGCEGILVILDTYFPVTEENQIAYFKAVAASISLPMVIYTNPAFAQQELSSEVIIRLSEIENIEYLKDASSNTGKLLTIINETRGKLKVFSASAHIPTSVMLIGGVGWMAGPACLVPKKSIRLYNLCQEGKWEEAIALQKKLWLINQIFSKFNLAACIKAGLEIQGYPVGSPIPPQAPLTDKEKAKVCKVLKEIADDD